MRTTIGIDIDNVIFDTGRLILKYLKVEDVEESYKKIYTHDIAKALSIDGDKVWEAVKKAVMEWGPPEVDGASAGLQWLRTHFNTIFITSRPAQSDIVAMTYNSIFNLNSLPTLIEFKDSPDWKKSHIINHYDIPLMIEDDTRHAIDILYNTDADILLFDRPWNQGDWVSKDFLSRVNRVYSWEDACNYIMVNYKGDIECHSLEER